LIAKLLPRLASNHDGDVVATARAIEKLKSASACSGASMKANEPMPYQVERLRKELGVGWDDIVK
jgi:hypothetical protein